MLTGTVTRRRFVKAGLLSASVLPFWHRSLAFTGQMLTPEQEVGPFYVRDEMLRSNIAEGKAGVPLHLRFQAFDHETGQALRSAAIDLWHCDAMGLYSGFTATKMGPPPEGGPGGGPGRDRDHGPGGMAEGGPDAQHQGPSGAPPDFGAGHEGGGPGAGHGGPHGEHGGPPSMQPSDHLTFMRGIQMTDKNGSASFVTVFPGFYQGRANHIHFKVRLDGHRSGTTYAAGHTSHTGQVFFPDELSVALMKQEPYRSHAIHRTTLAEDHVYNGEHGSLSMAAIRLVDERHPAAGYVADCLVAVDPRATPAGVGMGFGPPPR